MPNYTYPDSHTVKNKLGAATHDELEKREARFVALRSYEMALGYGPQGLCDRAHLKAIHGYLFQDVFEWAGRARNEAVPLADGTTASEPVLRKPGRKNFCLGPHIDGELDRITAHIRKTDYLRGLSTEDFAVRAADIFSDLNAVHPFREGNGRTQRVFIIALASMAGQKLDFTVISRERMLQASIKANDQNDKTMMQRLFKDAGVPARTAAIHQAIMFLQDQDFPWNDHYIATAEPEHEVEVTLAGIGGLHFMARAQNAVLIGNTADLPKPRPDRGERFILKPAKARISRRKK